MAKKKEIHLPKQQKSLVKMNPLWVGVNSLPQKSEPPYKISIKILALIQIKEEIPNGISSFISCYAPEGTRTLDRVPPPVGGNNPAVKNQRFLQLPLQKETVAYLLFKTFSLQFAPVFV